jgi:hypothetical protein
VGAPKVAYLIGVGRVRKSGRFGDLFLHLESTQLRVDRFFPLAVIQFCYLARTICTSENVGMCIYGFMVQMLSAGGKHRVKIL